jgi:predicted HTH domain antitoxin
MKTQASNKALQRITQDGLKDKIEPLSKAFKKMGVTIDELARASFLLAISSSEFAKVLRRERSRQKEVYNLKIKQFWLGLTYNELKRLER